jgi:hypothetical protein
MLEFKEESRTGQAFLMEVNGRYWGSLQLAIDAGVDFPFLAFQLALGRRPDQTDSYRPGMKSRWLLGDLDHLLLRLRHSDRSLNLPPSAPSKLQAVADFLTLAQRGLHYDVISLGDLRPFLHELNLYACDVAAAGARLTKNATMGSDPVQKME